MAGQSSPTRRNLLAWLTGGGITATLTMGLGTNAIWDGVKVVGSALLPGDPFPGLDSESIGIGKDILFSGSGNYSVIPSVFRETGQPITSDASRAAFSGICDLLEINQKNILKQDDIELEHLDGSAILLGGPLRNQISRDILGLGDYSPLLQWARSKVDNFPIRFDVRDDPKTITTVKGDVIFNQSKLIIDGKEVRVSRRNGDIVTDYLLITSVPNFMDRDYAVTKGRITMIAGVHAPGTKAISILLRDKRKLSELFERTKGMETWQALVRIDQIDPISLKPLSIGRIETIREIPVDIGNIEIKPYNIGYNL